jgi:uncharacterized low-complexity protein
MSEKKIIKPVALAVGMALAGTFAISGTVNADSIDSPFEISTLSVGYMLGEGEGSCGGDKGDEKEGEGSCGEGSCGGDKEGEATTKKAKVLAVKVHVALLIKRAKALAAKTRKKTQKEVVVKVLAAVPSKQPAISQKYGCTRARAIARAFLCLKPNYCRCVL